MKFKQKAPLSIGDQVEIVASGMKGKIVDVNQHHAPFIYCVETRVGNCEWYLRSGVKFLSSERWDDEER